MSEFKCKRCGHETSSLWNLKSHLSKATPCKDMNLCGKSQAELLQDITVDKSDWEFECDTCGAKYKSKQGLNFHIRNKKCNAEAIRKHQESKAGTSIINNGGVVNNSGIAVVNSPGTIVTTNINITINNFGEERIDYVINDKEFLENNMKCLSSSGLVNIINKIFNDNNYPENKTVHSQNKKKNTFKIRKENRWETAHAQQVIPSMMRKGCIVASTHYFNDWEAVERETKEAEEEGRQVGKQKYFNDMTNPNSTTFKNEYAKTKTLAHNY